MVAVTHVLVLSDCEGRRLNARTAGKIVIIVLIWVVYLVWSTKLAGAWGFLLYLGVSVVVFAFARRRLRKGQKGEHGAPDELQNRS